PRPRRFRGARPAAGPPADPRPDPLAELSARELLRIVDEELRRLPEVYRLPVILCCLEGRSLDEAARQLGWTLGSVKGRLERGRARLHDRLGCRGLAVFAALAAGRPWRGAGSAAVVARLVARTVVGAMAFGSRQAAAAEGVSAGAAALAREVVQVAVPARLKVAAALLVATGLLATGLVLYRAAQPPPPAALPVWAFPFPPQGPAAPTAPAGPPGHPALATTVSCR